MDFFCGEPPDLLDEAADEPPTFLFRPWLFEAVVAFCVWPAGFGAAMAAGFPTPDNDWEATTKDASGCCGTSGVLPVCE